MASRPFYPGAKATGYVIIITDGAPKFKSIRVGETGETNYDSMMNPTSVGPA